MKSQTKPRQKKPAENSVPGKKREDTRKMILAAARQIFAAHPYNAASIRMIAAQGDFYHGLIRYHFPSKAGIFEAVVEDACQSLGATYHGKAVGTFGLAGCFSFDSVKTVTCGEGGGIITDDKKVYEKADQFADHGHDHLGGPDRGADDHPIIGTNFRISELNAAVGLAQLRKLDQILNIQRENKHALKDAMADLPGVSFRYIPDAKGDSATFLSFFLPTEERTRQVAKALAANGAGAAFWYDNNWHYYKKWHHLKEMKRAARLPFELCSNLPDYKTLVLEESDNIMKRTLSMQIMISWTKQDIENRIRAIITSFKA